VDPAELYFPQERGKSGELRDQKYRWKGKDCTGLSIAKEEDRRVSITSQRGNSGCACGFERREEEKKKKEEGEAQKSAEKRGIASLRREKKDRRADPRKANSVHKREIRVQKEGECAKNPGEGGSGGKRGPSSVSDCGWKGEGMLGRAKNPGKGEPAERKTKQNFESGRSRELSKKDEQAKAQREKGKFFSRQAGKTRSGGLNRETKGISSAWAGKGPSAHRGGGGGLSGELRDLKDDKGNRRKVRQKKKGVRSK